MPPSLFLLFLHGVRGVEGAVDRLKLRRMARIGAGTDSRSLLLATVGVLASVAQTDVIWAVVWISIAIFGADMTLSPSWAACVDIGRRSAGAVSGTMNMAGNLGSFFTALAFPYLVEGFGSARPFFYVAAGLSLFSVLLWSLVRLDRPIESG